MMSLKSIADDFYYACRNNAWPSESESSPGDLSIEDAYRVQDLVAQKRIESGESIAGYKVGCTSDAIRQQFGLSEPISGRLFRPHVFDENTTFDWTTFVNCAIEPEMVFAIDRELRADHVTDEDLIKAIDYVSPAIELHHYVFWHQPPTTQELICSGGIHAGVVVGEARVNPRSLDFQSESFRVYQNDVEVTSGQSAAIMGSPLRSLRWLVQFLGKRNETLKPGSLVIPGSPVKLVNVGEDCNVRIDIENVGSMTVTFQRSGKSTGENNEPARDNLNEPEA